MKAPLKSDSKRKTHLDFIRIFAIYLVLFTHTGTDGAKLYTVCEKGISQIVYIMLDCFRTINNPLLFMVSGALLLGREESISIVWKKRVFRFVVVLFVFSYIQVFGSHYMSGDMNSVRIFDTFKAILSGPVRTSYWFIYSYISFLILLPLLRTIARNMQLEDGIYLFSIGVMSMDAFKVLKTLLGISRINLTLYFCEMIVYYPLLGFIIESKWDDITRRMKKSSLIILGGTVLISVAASTWATYYQFQKTQTWDETWITLLDPCLAVAIYMLFKKFGRIAVHPKLATIITVASGSMFGIYLMENMLKRWTRPVLYSLKAFLPDIIACLLWLMVVMIVGTIFIWLIKKISYVTGTVLLAHIHHVQRPLW